MKSLALIGKGPVQDQNKLINEIRKIRETGYATSTGEVVQGVTAIAVPLRNYVLPATLYIAGPDTRIGPKMQDFIAKTIKARDLIEEILYSTVKNNSGKTEVTL